MKNTVLLISTIFVVVMILVMRWQGAPLKTPVTKAGIVSLEFAKTNERGDECLDAWPKGVARTNTYIDFLFIVSYTLFLSTAIKAAVSDLGDTWETAGHIFVNTVYTAGLLDCLENAQMLRFMNGAADEWIIYSAYWLALVKFILAGLAVIFLLAAFVTRFISKSGKS